MAADRRRSVARPDLQNRRPFGAERARKITTDQIQTSERAEPSRAEPASRQKRWGCGGLVGGGGRRPPAGDATPPAGPRRPPRDGRTVPPPAAPSRVSPGPGTANTGVSAKREGLRAGSIHRRRNKVVMLTLSGHFCYNLTVVSRHLAQCVIRTVL